MHVGSEYKVMPPIRIAQLVNIAIVKGEFDWIRLDISVKWGL